MKYYVVWAGRKPGIFTTWAEAEAQVKGFSKARFQAFKTLAEAEQAFGYGGVQVMERPQPLLGSIIVPSISVDAACSGNPGRLEYRGVFTETREQVFHRGPFPNGTNNVGEFLAIVEALIICQEQGINWPIYSDSQVALFWVKSRQVRTGVADPALHNQVRLAMEWLEANQFSNQLLKWETGNWRENPADFGRK
jgi:ribonuclease HI